MSGELMLFSIFLLAVTALFSGIRGLALLARPVLHLIALSRQAAGSSAIVTVTLPVGYVPKLFVT